MVYRDTLCMRVVWLWVVVTHRGLVDVLPVYHFVTLSTRHLDKKQVWADFTHNLERTLPFGEDLDGMKTNTGLFSSTGGACRLTILFLSMFCQEMPSSFRASSAAKVILWSRLSTYVSTPVIIFQRRHANIRGKVYFSAQIETCWCKTSAWVNGSSVMW